MVCYYTDLFLDNKSDEILVITLEGDFLYSLKVTGCSPLYWTGDLGVHFAEFPASAVSKTL